MLAPELESEKLSRVDDTNFPPRLTAPPPKLFNKAALAFHTFPPNFRSHYRSYATFAGFPSDYHS